MKKLSEILLDTKTEEDVKARYAEEIFREIIKI